MNTLIPYARFHCDVVLNQANSPDRTVNTAHDILDEWKKACVYGIELHTKFACEHLVDSNDSPSNGADWRTVYHSPLPIITDTETELDRQRDFYRHILRTFPDRLLIEYHPSIVSEKSERVGESA